MRPARVGIQPEGISTSSTAETNDNLLHFAPTLANVGGAKGFYLRFRLQWMSDGATSMRGRVRSAERQMCSCKSSLTSCRVRSDRRGAPFHSLDLQCESKSALPFSTSLCFCGAWKHCEKSDFATRFLRNQRRDL